MDLQPHLHEGIYVFCKVSSLESITLDDCIGTFRESEGITVIISKEKADQLGLEYTYEAAWISLLADTALKKESAVMSLLHITMIIFSSLPQMLKRRFGR